MRFRHPDGTAVHLAYCTNVHPAETLEGITAQLAAYAEPVRRAAGESVIGLGLWLPVDAAAALAADPAAVTRLRRELSARGLETVTLNGFPYKGFHAPVVKRAVYYPDWSEPARLDYTLNLARVLAGLLPDDAERGSVSTLPLAWRTAWSRTQRAAATRQLDKLAAGLRRIEAETGRTVRVAVEPEPGCVAETTAQAVEALKGVDHEWIGLCLDACHLAVAHEEPDAAVAELLTAGLQVVKVQASSALQAADPADPGSGRPWRPSRSPASCTRPARPPRPAAPCSAPTTWDRRWPGPCPARRPGGSTTTYRCTRSRPRRWPPPGRCCGTPSGPCSEGTTPSPTTSRWRRTPGRCCPRAAGRWGTPGWPGASPPNSAGPPGS